MKIQEKNTQLIQDKNKSWKEIVLGSITTKRGVLPEEEVGVEIKKLTNIDRNKTNKRRKVTKEKEREAIEITTLMAIKETIIVQTIATIELNTQTKITITTTKIITTKTKMKNTMITKNNTPKSRQL